MTSDKMARRQVLRGIVGLAVAAPVLRSAGLAAELIRTPDVAGAPLPEQLHLQFGSDAAHQMAVSWAAPARVRNPGVRLGKPGHGLGLQVPAQEKVYTDVLTGQMVFTYHAELPRLDADTAYYYEVVHEGAPQPVAGSFRTAPEGRSKGFRFTSFGDQTIPAKVGLGLAPFTPNAGYIVDAVERLDPLFHLLNGDLCYANVSDLPITEPPSSTATGTPSRSARSG